MEEKFACNGNISIQYIVLNQSTDEIPVIFIPGAMVNIDEISNELKGYIDFYCIFVNIRGLGKSSSPNNGYSKKHLISDIESVVAAEKIDRCFMMGHSFGASIASAYSVKNPDEIRGLILCDYPPYYPAFPVEWADNLLQNDPELNSVLIKGLLIESKKEKFTEALSKCDFNILLLKGDSNDSAMPIEFAKRINKALPNSTLKIISSSGHEIFIENPQSSFEAVREFIGKK